MKQWNYIDKDTDRIEMKRNSFTINVSKNHGVIQLFCSMNFQLQKYPFCIIQYYHIQNILLMILLGSLGCVIFWNMGYRGIPIYRDPLVVESIKDPFSEDNLIILNIQLCKASFFLLFKVVV